MKIVRLTTCVELVRLWPFFASCLPFVSSCLRFKLPAIVYRRILQQEVTNHNSWVSVAYDDLGTPQSFLCAHEITPLFFRNREYEIYMFFHSVEQEDATQALQAAFEKWALEEGVVRYYVSTRFDGPSNVRCFQSEKYGMKRACTVFKKELKS